MYRPEVAVRKSTSAAATTRTDALAEGARFCARYLLSLLGDDWDMLDT